MDSYSEMERDQTTAQGLQESSLRNSRANDIPKKQSSGEHLYEQDRCADETKLLADEHHNETKIGSTKFATYGSPSSLSATPASSPLLLKSILDEPAERKENHIHFRKRANFRSDSMFSDVMPMASSSASMDPNKSVESESQESSGSLSSLKPKESKWASLRKKLGKINISTTRKFEHKQPNNPVKSVEEKRTLLQRAKTLSILPVRSSREKEDQPKKSKERKSTRVEEMFNVGGEMNMIPLELLIDVNDLKVSK